MARAHARGQMCIRLDLGTHPYASILPSVPPLTMVTDVLQKLNDESHRLNFSGPERLDNAMESTSRVAMANLPHQHMITTTGQQQQNDK